MELLRHLRRALPVPAAVALRTQAGEVGEAVRLPLRELVFRQVVVAELEVVPAAVRDLRRHVRGGGLLREEGAHLLLALEVELLGLELHPVRIVHGLARLDAHEHVLAVGVLFIYIMRIVGEHQRDAGVPGETAQAHGGFPLLGDAVVLDLQIEVLPEQLPQLQGLGLRVLIFVVDQPPGDIPRQASGQADQPLAVGVEQLPVDPGTDVEAVGEAAGHQVAEVAVADVVFAQEDQMTVLRIDPVLLLETGPGSHIYLAADDGPDSLRQTGTVKGHRAVHDAVVRHRQGGLAQLFGPLRQILDPTGAVQQGVFRMHMEVYEAHPMSPLYSSSFFSRWLMQLLDTGGSASRARSERLDSGLAMRSMAVSCMTSGRLVRP